MDVLSIAPNLKHVILHNLNQRSYRICVGKFMSTYVLSCGVPQGSSFESPVFTLFINNLPNILTSTFSYYVNDLKIFLLFEFRMLLIHTAISICHSNDLVLHYLKMPCSVIRQVWVVFYDYQICQVHLNQVFSNCDRGVTFDWHLILMSTFREWFLWLCVLWDYILNKRRLGS